jgi:hypothetical protein
MDILISEQTIVKRKGKKSGPLRVYVNKEGKKKYAGGSKMRFSWYSYKRSVSEGE